MKFFRKIRKNFTGLDSIKNSLLMLPFKVGCVTVPTILRCAGWWWGCCCNNDGQHWHDFHEVERDPQDVVSASPCSGIWLFLYWLLQQYCCCTVKQEPFHFTTLHSFSNLELIFPDLTSSWIKIQDCLREKGHMKFEVTEIYLNIIFEFSHQYELSLSIMTICLSTYCSYYFGYCNVALVLLKMFSFRFQQDEFSFYLCLSDEFFSWVSSSSRDFGIRVEKSNLWNSPSSLLLCSLPQVHFIVYVIL